VNLRKNAQKLPPPDPRRFVEGTPHDAVRKTALPAFSTVISQQHNAQWQDQIRRARAKMGTCTANPQRVKAVVGPRRQS
jgi:hypothetical protein